MTARSPGAFMLSAVFHAAIIGAVFLVAFMADQQAKVTPHVLELVAGAGDNYGATVAPRLGKPGGVKVDLSPVREPERTPTPPAPPAPQPVEEKPVPITPAPTPPKSAVAPPKVDSTIPNFKRQIQRKVWAADAKAKKEVARERAEEQKRLKKEEYDRLMRERAKVASAKSSSTPRVSHIDAEGIAKGVVGGSTENTVGGAGGKALVRNDGALIDAYYALLRARVEDALDKPPNLGDDLVTTIVFHISAAGRISNVRIAKSSGSEEWDHAVAAAFAHVEMPEHPDHKGEDLELAFRTNAVER